MLTEDGPLSERTSPGRTYQVVVIGSGYGGAILAARLAAKKLDVALFERGREWAPDALPSTLADAAAQVKRPSNPLGLFDLRQGDDLDVLSGSGLGGTSLINGNVAVRAPVEVFDDPRWPAPLRGAKGRAGLDAYYAMAEAALGARQTPDALALSKVRARTAYTARAKLELRIPKLTIHFGDDAEGGPPSSAPPSSRRACVMCGDCIVGCRVGAKNTLTQNYLSAAKQSGATIVTQTEARFVLPHPAGGWEIHARSHPAEGGPPTEHVVRASAVVVAAGALGSTSILLRSRVRGLRLGARLGHHFGGNADRAGYGYNNDTFIGAIGRRDAERNQRPVGPTIASMTVHTDPHGRQFLIQEGAVPSPLVLPTRVLLAAAAATRGEDTDAGAADAAREAARIARDAFALGDKGALAHTMLMLAMGDDDADGRVILDAREAPRVVWGGLADKPIFRAMDAEMRAQVAALGGTWVPNPNPWRGFGGPPMTVHPLGGVPMGDDVDAGVVDHLGRVFDPDGGVLPGLYVVDGSIVPSSLRVNPMLTIAALAERVAEAFDPASVAPAPAPSRVRAAPVAPIGLSFTETMTGWFDPSLTTLSDTQAFLERDHEVRLARRSAGRVPAAVSFRLTITVEDLEKFLADPAHLANAEGYVDGPWGPKRLVERASFNLLVDAAEPDTKLTRYALAFYDDSGKPHRLEGEKRVHDDEGYDSFADATTLFVTVRAGFGPGGRVEGQGVMHIEGPDLVRQLATFRAHRATSFEASVRALSRFGAFFFGNLWEPFVRPKLFGSDGGEG